MRLEINSIQAHIILQLLEWHIENLIDEPLDSPRGAECAESQSLFDQTYEALSNDRASDRSQ